jgi:putative nucleotidyltransferase with HDIG domain
MSAKILQMVNSAYFGLPRKMTDPQQAAVFLGLETLKGVILSSHVFSSFTDDADACGFSLADMWKHSLLTGRLAKEIASSQNGEIEAREEALTTGLLHDIGKLVLLKMPEKYKEITTYVEQNGCDFLYAEYEILQTSHAELGAYLLGLWGIDDKIVEAVAFHHNPSNLLEEVLFMLSNPTDDEEGKIKQKESNLKSWSAEKCSKEFATLTSVHVANSLLVQNAPSHGGTFSPPADTLYLRTLNLEERMTVWEDACYRIQG